jgi:hypothetical protein
MHGQPHIRFVNKTFTCQGHYEALRGQLLPEFQKDLSVQFLRVKQSMQPPGPSRLGGKFVPKRRYLTTNQRSVTAQNSEHLIKGI